jgi:hypothetical protein
MALETKAAVFPAVNDDPSSESGISLGENDIYIDPKAEARVIRKCDMFLVPLLTLAFLSAYLDRNNIGNAAAASLLIDLKMSKQQFASKTFITL